MIKLEAQKNSVSETSKPFIEHVKVQLRDLDEPIGFTIDGECWLVSQVVNWWYESGPIENSPVYACLRVMTEDGDFFVLRYNCYSMEWGIHPE